MDNNYQSFQIIIEAITVQYIKIDLFPFLGCLTTDIDLDSKSLELIKRTFVRFRSIFVGCTVKLTFLGTNKQFFCK